MTDSEVLKARAKVLAQPLANDKEAVATLEVLAFRLAHERYAVEQAYAREVCPLKELTPLPGTPAFYAGIVNVRGQVLPVLDIKKFFDLPESGITDLHVIVVVHSGEIELGILADAVDGMRSVPLTSIQPSLPTLTGIREQYLKGVTADQRVILDVPKILADPKLIVNEDA
jgi:purine-binding chemotaxis protein CheW